VTEICDVSAFIPPAQNTNQDLIFCPAVRDPAEALASGHLIKQCFSIPEVRLIEALGEPLVDRR
jgi:hypothetical protein